MSIVPLLVGLAAAAAVWNVVTTLRVYAWRRDRGLPTNFLLLRVLILEYLAEYRRHTLAESGRVGPLFYHALISINLALFAALAALALSVG